MMHIDMEKTFRVSFILHDLCLATQAITKNIRTIVKMYSNKA